MERTECIEHVLATSRRVFEDCVFPNGAIVAAPSHMPYYPKGAKNYCYVWPRDAMFISRAARLVGLELSERFFEWCMQAEGWKETGLLYKKYHVGGQQARRSWQPDQTGAILIALHDAYAATALPDRFVPLLVRTADALSSHWNGRCLTLRHQELWEERYVSPDLEGNFAYTLAACARGLLCADDLRPNKRWREAATEMTEVIGEEWPTMFGRSAGLVRDDRIDASLVALSYPFDFVDPDDPRMDATIREIEERLVVEQGVMRYEGDDYDGWMMPDGTTNRKLGAGAWPLLTLWLAILHSRRGDRGRAVQLYDLVLSQAPESGFIAEQVFNNNVQIAVSPLAWSHAMFVLASQELGYL